MIRLFENKKKTAVCGWNEGIKRATGDLIMIAGSHSVYPKDYVSKCVKWSKHAENVGGGIVSVVRENNSALSKSLLMARDDKFGTGGSVFRTGAPKPRLVDTVFGGCYRREVFDKIGLFNEKLERSGDLEFNLRLKEAGMKTWYVPEIYAIYYARTNWWEFCKHNFKDGKWSLLMMKYSKVKFGMRRLIPLLFVLTVPFAIFPYGVLALVRSIQIAKLKRDWELLFTMPIAFLSLHFSYGLGSLSAIPKFLWSQK